ncbi:hypothetical protein KI387_032306, partial [Taxus chinensis]
KIMGGARGRGLLWLVLAITVFLFFSLPPRFAIAAVSAELDTSMGVAFEKNSRSRWNNCVCCWHYN